MSDAYQSLKERFQQIYRLQHLGAIASWDQSAMMPKGGNQARGEALAELHSLLHSLLTAPQVGECIQQARNDAGDHKTSVSLREMEREWLNASVIPEKLVKAKTIASNQCEHAWRIQRQEDDWQGFSKNLKEVVKLTCEEAQIRAERTGRAPYDALMDFYEPGMSSKQIDQLFGDLTSWLPGYIQQASEKQKSEAVITPEGSFSIESQKNLGLEVMKLLKFDFDHGRVDISAHPFCGGVNEDVRITTRYSESNFVEALMGTIHETGHARYNQNLPAATRGLPVNSYRSMGIHESQSLFFEMQLSRSPEFLSLLRPLIIKHLCNGKAEPYTDQTNLEKLYTRVKPGYIRFEADEITYPAQFFASLKQEQPNINEQITKGELTPIFDWLNRNIWSQGSYYTTDQLVNNATGESLNTRYFKQHLEQRYL